MDYLYYLFIVIAFITVVLFFEGLYLLWSAHKSPEAIRMEKRLQSIAGGWHGNTAGQDILKQRLLSESARLERLLWAMPRIHELDRLLAQSGLQLNAANFLGLTALAAFVGFVLASLFHLSFAFAMLCAGIGGSIPLLFVFSARQKRLLKIEEQLPDSIDLLARALKAGHAFSGALQITAEESSDPIAGEFRITFDEVNFGIAMQDALMNLSTRVPIIDLRYLIIAILIQRESGGNLAELLENISGIIRARLKLLATIRVLSAEGKLSAWILGGLPFVMAGYINIANPEYLNVLFTDPLGHTMLGVISIMMIIGIFVMWRIIKIRV